ncbi:MAG: FliI/YscN family ATPase [Alphaproteobacteria bacterium]
MSQAAERSERNHLKHLLQAIEPRPLKGRVIRATGTVIHAAAPDVAVGELCRLRDPNSGRQLLAEAVGLAGETVILTPIGDMRGLSTQTEVMRTGAPLQVAVGPALLGQILDSLGHRRGAALDQEAGAPETGEGWTTYPIHASPPDAMARQLISRPMPLGIRVIDGLLTTGEGQRIGIYGAPGTGKSSLLASIVKGAEADVAVVALIGERGREVREFVERHLGEDGRKKSVLVVATSDRSAMERVKAAYVATAIAEYFRDQDKRVLLLIDSITRFARAQREIGLAAGEPPTRRGFPPSVFAELPRLLERAGAGSKGSITAFYSVLMEGDGTADPIAEESRGILDGHITLSPKLGGAGHYPAIDVLESRSRVMESVASRAHIRAATHLRALLARHQEIELLLRVGEYQPGSDPLADEAVAKIKAIRDFLKQGEDERTGFDDMLQRLQGLAG